jgi:hypothetical protein
MKSTEQSTRRRKALNPIILIAVVVPIVAVSAQASGHSDAPLIKQDPQANITDVYAFIGTKYDNPAQKVLNVLVNVYPFCEPGDGPNYYQFSDEALYTIHITEPSTGHTVLRYDFQFSSITEGLKNPDTILSYGLGTETGPITTIGDNRQNYTQTYRISRNGALLASGLPVAPPNVGLNTTPGYNDPATGRAVSGAATLDELDPLTRQAIQDLPNGAVVWAGPRDDAFYADTAGVFDLLNPRIFEDKDNNPATGFTGQDGGGPDTFQGYNVLTYALQIPVDALTVGTYRDPILGGNASGVGVYAAVSRPQTTLRSADARPVSGGPWIQVNRMGNPLFNEVFIALKDKDKYNRTSPSTDTLFRTYALVPEISRLINLALFDDPEGDGPLPMTNSMLGAVYIPDVIRVNTTTDPVRLPGQAGFHRLGLLGSDFAGGGTTSASGGWPNGRRVGDDVMDIALTMLTMFTKDLGDNVNANDIPYNQVFPYLATPHAGTRDRCPPESQNP